MEGARGRGISEAQRTRTRRGVRTRGGVARGSGVETPVSENMAVAGRGHGWGRGTNRPHAVDELRVVPIEELLRADSIEVPLTKRRRRNWPPSAVPSSLSVPSPAPPSPGISGGPSGLLSVPSPTPSSPEILSEVRHDENAMPPPGHDEVALPPPPIEFFLHQGSEDEAESDAEHSEEEDLTVPVFVPRYERQFGVDSPLTERENEAPAAVFIVTPEDAVASPEDSVASPQDSVVAPPDDEFYDFRWTAFPNPPPSSEFRRETFSNINVGPTTPMTDPYDIFTAIWDQPIMEDIVSQTNKYAREQIDLLATHNMLRPRSRLREWRDTTINELYTYLAILLAMGCVVKTRLETYWSDCMTIFVTPQFRAYMTLRRFQLLSRCLHFASNEALNALNVGSAEAKIFKVKPVVDHLNKKFQQMYNLRQNIALDESLLQWKGCFSFNQHIPNKAARIGIKTYEVCESQSGYLWRFEIHAHKKSPQEPVPVDPLQAFTPALVLRLLDGLENKGHTVWMDNYYNYPVLARKLKTLGFDCVGTLRTNRQFVPEELHRLTKEKMRPGTITGYTSGDVDIMVWRDKNRVATISTYHSNNITTKEGVTKPNLVWDYNIMMGGVDKKDQMLAMYPVERKRTRVWYKKLFRRLLNVSVLNAYIICKRSSSRIQHCSFRESLVNTLLEKHAVKRTAAFTPQNLSVEFHHLAEFSVPPGKTQKLRRACNICKKRVHTYCVGCDKTVCMTPCFVRLHVG